MNTLPARSALVMVAVTSPGVSRSSAWAKVRAYALVTS
jgi:hypothetical protein